MGGSFARGKQAARRSGLSKEMRAPVSWGEWEKKIEGSE
jgi:hypothetical protein